LPPPWPSDTKLGGKESHRDVHNRTVDGMREILEKHKEGDVIVVTHGGPIRLFLCYVMGLPAENMHLFEVQNTSISMVRFKSGLVDKIVCVNDASHNQVLTPPIK